MDSVTDWIIRLKEGESEAQERLWNRYLSQLVAVAQRRLMASNRRVEDEEDAVLSAYTAFLTGVEDGRFSKLDDRTDLWQILVMLIDRKAIAQIRRDQAEKRGGGQTVRSIRSPQSSSRAEGELADLEDPAPTPQEAIELNERLRELLASLDDEVLVRIAIAKLESRTNREIAELLGIGLSTVERKLALIRSAWSRELHNSSN